MGGKWVNRKEFEWNDLDIQRLSSLKVYLTGKTKVRTADICEECFNIPKDRRSIPVLVRIGKYMKVMEGWTKHQSSDGKRFYYFGGFTMNGLERIEGTNW